MLTPLPHNFRGRWPKKQAAVLAVLFSALAWFTFGPDGADPDGAAPVTPPWEFTTSSWDVLGGDRGVDASVYTSLNAEHPGLADEAATQAMGEAVAVLRADLTGADRSRWPGYWPPAPTTGAGAPVRCTTFNPLAASPARMPVTTGSDAGPTGVPPDGADSAVWVKTMVAYAGACGDRTYTRKDPAVAYVYGTLTADTKTSTVDFSPVRPWNIPTDPQPEPTTGALEDWQLSTLSECVSATGEPMRMRTAAAAAVDQMCAQARKEGVVLVAEAAYRTPAEQAALFAEAVEFYGSTKEAETWVARADADSCESKHCTGLAVNFEPDHQAITWLTAAVACAAGSEVTALDDGQECSNDTTPVTRAQQYGLVFPYGRIPGYGEFVLNLDDDAPLASCSPDGVPAAEVVASVFRCRLEREQVDPMTVEQTVARAVVVAKCASGWNPAARVFAGRYATEPNPDDGRIYSEAGLFGLRGELVETGWVPGDVLDPVASANAAASLWLASRGWEQFPCATGTDQGLPAGPVLPEYGGPVLPEWALGY